MPGIIVEESAITRKHSTSVTPTRKRPKTEVARATNALERFGQLTKASRPPGTNGNLRKPRVVAPTLRRRRNDPTGTRTPLVSSVIWTRAHTRRKLCPLTPKRETPPHWDPKGSPSAPSGPPTHTYPAKLHPPKSEIRTNQLFSKTQSRSPLMAQVILPTKHQDSA